MDVEVDELRGWIEEDLPFLQWRATLAAAVRTWTLNGRDENALPRGRLVTIPRAGHLSPMEAPAEVTAVLSDLLVGRRAAGAEGSGQPA